MDETFAILIDSKSRFETGAAGGFWLDLPATKEQLHAAMESVGITTDNPQDFFIRGYSDNEQTHIALPHDMVCAANVDELNFLAARIAEIGPAELQKLNVAVQSKIGFENIGQIIDFTYNTDFFVQVPEAHTARELGDYYLNKSGAVQMPEEWKGGIDLAMFGQHAAERENGAFTQYGYITKSGDEWERHFEGRDVPEEYRIMSYPQPVRLDPEKVEFDMIATRQATVLTAEPSEAIPVKPIIPTATDPNGKLKEITDRLEQGIADLFNSERFKEYLNVMSKFHNYSFNNTVLIALQKPDASLVMGFNAWKGKGFERNVKKGEQGIRIFAPAPYKIKTEVEKLDPDTKKPIIGEDGKPITETKEIMVPAFKVVCVYDVSQTEGKELPTLGVDELLGNVENYKDFFAALEKTSPVPIVFEQIEGGAHGYYHLEDKRIALDEGMSELQTLKTVIHEIAHAKLHDIDLNAPAEERANRPDRRTREVEAESVAYTVCQHYGLDTSDYSFGYVAGWSSGREMSELKSSLETIRATAAEIIDSIDAHIAELQKEREAEAPELDPKGEPTVTIIWSENGKLRDGETMPLFRANALFEALDAQNKDTPGYDKTKFRLDFTLDSKPEQYEGRQDLGDGEESLIDHIEKFNAYYLNNEEWQNQLLRSEGREAMEADRATRELLVGEVVPYLRLHCKLSEMEQAAKTALHNTASLTPIDTAYFTAITEHVAECRAMLNSGTYELPEAPKRSDFDPELQAYKEQVKAEIEKETYFEIYQIANTQQTAEIVFEPYDRLTATGHIVDPANYELVYAAPLTPDMTLEDIYTRFNIAFPEDYTGRSLSLSDVVVLHQDGDVSAHYVDSVGFREVPQFLECDKSQMLIPDEHTTGEKITTPRGSFSVTDMTREQMEAAGYGVHHTSDDGKHLIMGNGTHAFAVAVEQPTEKEKPLKANEPSKETTPTVMYYPINEGAARRAKEANSFSDYVPGSATASYRQAVNEAAELAARQKSIVDPSHHAKIDSLLDTYARKLAENMNKSFAIESRVPSVMIAGPANFPVRKKEKQNAARHKNMEEWQEINGLLDKIRSTGMGGISADDPRAVEKLQSKLEKLEAAQEKMKAVNAYYRKHKTLDDCPHLNVEVIEQLKADMASNLHIEDKPYPTWALTNNGAEIRRLKERIAELTRREETAFVGWEFDGGKVEANRQENRLQIFFDEKPAPATREELKNSGFRWSPNAGAWQRQLNDNTIYAANGLKCIQPTSGERPTDIQRKARAAARAEKPEEKPSIRAQLTAEKKEAASKKAAKTQNNDLEV